MRPSGKLLFLTAWCVLPVAICGCERHAGSFEWGSGPAGTAPATGGEPSPPINPVEARRPLHAAIHVPQTGATIRDSVYNEMTGTIDLLPAGSRAYIFLHSEFGWFLQYPAVRVDPRTNTFTAGNIRMATPGRWEIHVSIASRAGAEILERMAMRADWGAISSLPEGVESVGHVAVVRE